MSKSCLGGASHSDRKRRRSLLNVVTLSLLPKCNIYTVAFGFTPDIHHHQDNWGTSKCSPNDFFSLSSRFLIFYTVLPPCPNQVMQALLIWQMVMKRFPRMKQFAGSVLRNYVDEVLSSWSAVVEVL